MHMDRRQLKRRFMGLEMLYWVTYGSFTSYIVSMLVDQRGASASAAGMLLAVFMASACLGQYVMGALCDRRQNNRAVFAANMGLTIAVQLGFYFSPNLILMGVCSAALGFILPPTGAILDTWLIRSFPGDGGAYAPIRAYGSLAYAFLMAGMGLLIERVGYGAMPAVSTCLAVATICLALKTPEIPKLPDAGRGEARSAFRMTETIWLFIAALGVLGVATMPLLNMSRMIMMNVGGTVASVGIATAFNTVAEFIVMRTGFGVKRLSPGVRLIAAAALYVLSTGMMLLAGSVWLLYPAFFVNGLSYGVFLPARRAFAEEIAPPEAHNRVHALGDMAYLNIGGLAGNQAGGVILDRFGVGFLLRLCGGIQVAALLLTVWLRAKAKAE